MDSATLNSGSAPHDYPLKALSDQYLKALLSHDRDAAWHMLDQALVSGHTLDTLYLQVLEPSQHEVGRLWESNALSVVEEHYCTAATQTFMARLRARVEPARRHGRGAVVAGVGRELHEVGARMVADLLELDGWDVAYLGANLPAAEIAEAAANLSVDLVCLSCTMNHHVPIIFDCVAAIRQAAPRARIIAGGNPFNADPDLWKQLGADGTAPDARSAVALAWELTTR